MSEQFDLFEQPSLNPTARVKEAMRSAIVQSGLSRAQVVDQINELARVEGIATNGRSKELSNDMLDKWLSSSADHIMPWKLLPIFCHAVDSIAPLVALVAPLGAKVIDQKDSCLLAWAKKEMERKSLVKKIKKLELEIGS